MNAVLFILLGLAAGTLSGILGIGGGIVVIPVLTYFFKMSQQQAQGTTLAMMLPPIGLLAAWNYYRHGAVDISAAAFICIGFLFGGLLGSNIIFAFSDDILRKSFGVFLLLVSVHMIFFK
jgi:uncharacterized protein